MASWAELRPRVQAGQPEKLQTPMPSFEHNTHRMKYTNGITARTAVEAGTATVAQKTLANEPLGSGANEATRRQYQSGFKRSGQFWTTARDEAIRDLETC